MTQTDVFPRRPVRGARRRAPDDGGRTATTPTDRERPSADDTDGGVYDSVSRRRLRADLYVRAHSPAPERDRSVVATLDALAAGGRLDDYAVHRIPHEVDVEGEPSAETDGHVQSLLAVADRLSERADGRGYPFRRVSRRSAITGEANTVLLLPARCLLLYEGSDLIDVAPHHGPDGPWTVEDSLGTVAASAPATGEVEVEVSAGRSVQDPDRESAGRLDAPEGIGDGGQ